MIAPVSYEKYRHAVDGKFHLERVEFDDLKSFRHDNHLEAYQAFLVSAQAVIEAVLPTRPARELEPEFVSICRLALQSAPVLTNSDARSFFLHHFQPYRIQIASVDPGNDNGFLTGYYEPEVDGSLAETEDFWSPIYARPSDLITFVAGRTPAHLDRHLSAGRRHSDGTIKPYPDRAMIDAGAIVAHTNPLVWLRDPIEVFLVQVQGSARVRLNDGRLLRLGYAGRNGQPYTSIGRILIQQGEIPEAEMSLARLKHWIRSNGQKPGQSGLRIMHENKSYVFFKIDDQLDLAAGPVGAAGISLTPLRSLAVDRNLWHYGLPFWVEANLISSGFERAPFHRLMIAQDTGSAIVGPARADIFFGSGEEAGRLAGGVRHTADIYVLLPRAGVN